MSAVYHKLSDSNLMQDWSSSSQLLNTDDWSGVPSIQAFSTVEFGSGFAVDPRAFVGESQDPDVSTDELTSPSGLDTDIGDNGGAAEFQDFSVLGLGAGASAKAPNLVLYLDTTDMTVPVTLDFDVQDLDGSARDSEKPLTVQYRLGETGPWVNLPGGYIEDVTQPNGTPETHMSLTLPVELLGQPQVQVRILTTDALGEDEWIGIDNIVVACFLRGTLIRTPEGDIPVETLAIGDQVVTSEGLSEPVKWIGRRAFSTRFLSLASPVTPVVVRAGALGDSIPYRDLRISPEHALYIDDVLVPAICLVNGSTITRELENETVEYFHIELGSHGIVFADGAPAETYVNHANRMMFANWPEYHAIYGEDEEADVAVSFARTAPCVRSGPVLEAIRQRLAQRVFERAA
jgi:hypothetical protein